MAFERLADGCSCLRLTQPSPPPGLSEDQNTEGHCAGQPQPDTFSLLRNKTYQEANLHLGGRGSGEKWEIPDRTRMVRT